MFIYLIHEISTKLSVDSFHFSSYPFRKSPEEEKKMMQHRNRANMPQVILSSKVFAFSIDLQILRKPIQWWYLNFDGITGVTKFNL